MLNLLPEYKKKIIEKEYKTRRLNAVLILGCMVVFTLLVLLLPTYFFVNNKFTEAKDINDILTRQIESQKTDKTNITGTQKQIITFLQKDSKVSSSTPTEIIKDIISNKDSNISIKDFLLKPKEATDQIMIHGLAKKREDLIAFRDRLEKDSLFKKVELPISDIGPATNNQFTFTLTLK